MARAARQPASLRDARHPRRGETGGKPLELSVTALPNTGSNDADYLLVNVNRWRNQLRMPPITAAELPAESTEIKLDGATATLVNLAGHAKPGGMGGPFFPGATDGN